MTEPLETVRYAGDPGRRSIRVVSMGAALVLLLGTGCTSDRESSLSSSTTTRGKGGAVPGGTEGTESPTSADQALVAQFLELANHPDQERAKRLPFAAQVQLGLGQDLHVTRSPFDLARADAWSIDVEHFRAYSGPFSALDVARDAPGTIVSVGNHTRCASPPEPAPVGTEHLRRLSVQPEPSAYDSCLKWWSVDLFVNADGQIEAVTLDAYEP